MINKVILLGNLGADPEIQYTAGGTAVATLRVATTEQWKDKDGEKKEHTEWHRVIVWGRLGEICGEILEKGSKVYIEGKNQTREWTDQNDVKKYTTEVVAKEMKALSRRKSEGQHNPGGSSPDDSFPEPPPGMTGTGEDVPF